MCLENQVAFKAESLKTYKVFCVRKNLLYSPFDLHFNIDLPFKINKLNVCEDSTGFHSFHYYEEAIFCMLRKHNDWCFKYKYSLVVLPVIAYDVIVKGNTAPPWCFTYNHKNGYVSYTSKSLLINADPNTDFYKLGQDQSFAYSHI